MHIVGWTHEEDYPDSNELSLIGIELTDQQDTLQYEGKWRFPLSGDKLLGWPAWQQGIERIRCPECDSPMREIFQIDSCDAVPLMFADGGRG